jgi:hypothetical protein
MANIASDVAQAEVRSGSIASVRLRADRFRSAPAPDILGARRHVSKVPRPDSRRIAGPRPKPFSAAHTNGHILAIPRNG